MLAILLRKVLIDPAFAKIIIDEIPINTNKLAIKSIFLVNIFLAINAFLFDVVIAIIILTIEATNVAIQTARHNAMIIKNKTSKLLIKPTIFQNR